jgi:thiamine pyrophosphate-dependent acetolactate synthase large subunit-like protein
MSAPITKMSVTLDNPNEATKIFVQALSAASAGRKRPVYIGIPRNIQTREIEASEPLWSGKPRP